MEIERRFIVVSCLDRTKKVEMTEPITLDYVRSMVQNRFSVDDFDLQYFDNDVSEYIDLDSTAIADLRNSRIVKIKVIRVSASPTSITKPVTPSTSESGNATLKNAETVNPQPSANNRPSSAAEAVAQTLTDEVNNPETTVATSNKTTKRRNWPKIYKLPKDVIPRGVLLKLEQRLTISATDIRHFLDAIYNDVSRYEGGLYPTPDMYNEVVDSIFRDYPYLLKEGGISASSNRTFWKDKLVFKFGNSRKQIDASHPDVIQRKKAKVVSGPKTNADIQTERTWGLANFLPTSPITEDELSIDTHIKWLQREYRKTMDSDVTTVDMKMDLTFPHRRQKIISDKIALSEILEMYPWLQTRDQLLKEFARLKPNTTSLNLEDLLADNLKLYRYSVFQLVKGKKLPRYLQDMLSSHSQLQTEGQRHYAEDCICLLGLLVLFKESGDKLLSFRKADTPATTSGFKLVVQDNILTVDKSAFSLTIDGCDLFSCETFFELFSGMMAAIYTFNLAYPKPWERMLLFSQNILVGLKDSSGKLNKRILNVFTLIHNQMKSQ